MADTKIDITQQVSELAQELTQLIKQELRDKGLVSHDNKPHLIDSIKIVYSITPDGFSFDLECFDYFWFLDEKYNILNDLFDSPSYSDIAERIIEINGIIIEAQVNEALD